MHIGRVLAAFLALLALLMAGGGSAFCMPAGGGDMPCCKSGRPCVPGMKQANCCRFVPATPGHVPAAVETALPSKVSHDEMKGAILAEVVPISSPLAEVAPEASPSPLPQRSPPVPIYVLNASLLR